METAPFYHDIARAPTGGICEYRTASDGVRLRVMGWKGGSNGTILIFHGRTEYCEKYGPVVQNFLDRGYNVAMLDWRGQGLSDRLHRRPTIGHVEDFLDYQNDVEVLLDFVKDHALNGPYVLLGHSMGGAIGLRAITNGLDVRSAIFSAPMWDIAINGWGNHIVKAYCFTIGKWFFRDYLVPSTNIRNPSFVQDLDTNNLTNNAYEYFVRIKQLSLHPDLEIGGPSIQWVTQALAETKALRDMPRPSIKAHCFVGTGENIVSQDAINTVMENWPNGDLTVFPKAKHELMIEEAHITKEFWSTIDSFLSTAEAA